MVDGSSLQVGADSGAAAQETAAVGLRDGGRLAGPTRIDTAIAIAGAQFPDGAATVYLANAQVVVDAVVGGVLTDGPVLLVPSCGQLPSSVAAEIARLDPFRVIALGGEATLCASMLDQARAA